ncbi:MAG: hypothetical protein C0466_09710 [Candidatus Accumulibacter sp.]|nr:hypothetical protein [Accumulibacter sp.]
MKHRLHSPAPRRQRGVSIISAIFMLLLFAALAGLMASLMSTANVTSAQDIQGARAYQAAQAGVEWGLFQLDPEGAGTAMPSCVSGTLPAAAIPEFTVAVSCSKSDYNEAGRSISIYLITATARSIAASSVTIERQVEASIEKCRPETPNTAAPYDC